jgi:hypothetical protein
MVVLEIKCIRCKRVLGKYEGESFNVYPVVDFMEIVCDRCLGKKEMK